MSLSSSQPAPFVLVTLRARGLSLAATGIHLSSLTGTSFSSVPCSPWGGGWSSLWGLHSSTSYYSPLYFSPLLI